MRKVQKIIYPIEQQQKKTSKNSSREGKTEAEGKGGRRKYTQEPENPSLNFQNPRVFEEEADKEEEDSERSVD